MYARMYIRAHVRTRACTYARVRVCVRVRARACVHNPPSTRRASERSAALRASVCSGTNARTSRMRERPKRRRGLALTAWPWLYASLASADTVFKVPASHGGEWVAGPFVCTEPGCDGCLERGFAGGVSKDSCDWIMRDVGDLAPDPDTRPYCPTASGTDMPAQQYSEAQQTTTHPQGCSVMCPDVALGASHGGFAMYTVNMGASQVSNIGLSGALDHPTQSGDFLFYCVVPWTERAPVSDDEILCGHGQMFFTLVSAADLGGTGEHVRPVEWTAGGGGWPFDGDEIRLDAPAINGGEDNVVTAPKDTPIF